MRFVHACSAAGHRVFSVAHFLLDRRWTFWTLTVWDSQTSMRTYLLSGDHKRVMPRLLDWCDQASLAHWESTFDQLPAWPEVDRRMRSEGRTSKVRNPAPGHVDMSFEPPRLTGSVSLSCAG